MFETLDLIDWANIGHNGASQEIPNRIRHLASSNPEERLDALKFLFGEGQDYGSVYPSTGHIIPFVLEILADDGQLGRITLLERLGALTTAKVYTGGRREYSIKQMRTYLNAYDALERGLPLYVRLLDDQNEKIRAASATVLGSLSASAATILPILQERFTHESVEKTQIAFVEAIAHLLVDLDYSGAELRKATEPFFYQIIESNFSLQLRTCAAKAAVRASVSRGFEMRLQPEEVPARLVSTLIEQYWALPDDFHSNFTRGEIVQLLALFPDKTPLIELLNHPNTSPDEAHLIVRGLLAQYVTSLQLQEYWFYRPRIERPDNKKVYEIYQSSIHLRHPKTKPVEMKNLEANSFYDRMRLSKMQTVSMWDVLRSIVDADKYWSIPTNLLSVMFNLPDDREQLRTFIEKTD